MKKSQIDDLKLAIQELHEKGGDWGLLFNQIGKEYNALVRNPAQVRFFDLLPIYKKITCVWSRGVGKTTAIADLVCEIRRDMPRCVIVWIVPSYKKFKKEIMPSFRKAMEMLGYYEGLQYMVGSRPLKKWKWETAWQTPEDYTNVITFPEGTLVQVVSQDVDGAGRGLNADVIIKDEALMLDKATMEETTTATLRGSNVEAFEDCVFFGTDVTLSSMPVTQGGKWVLDGKRLAREYPNEYYYSSYNYAANAQNLMKGYLENAKKTAIYDWVFKAEFLNVEPSGVLDSYYALLNEVKHVYYPKHGDFREHDDCRYDYAADDLWADLPVIIGVDWGTRINYMVVCQLRDEGDGLYLRALNEFWALGEEGEIQGDMVKKFLEYYSLFTKKHAILFFDRQGNNRTGLTTETRAEMLISQMNAAKWTVDSMSRGGANVAHSFRRLLAETILKEDDRRLPKFRINKLNCSKLLISMQNAQTKGTKRTITKSKASEGQNSGVHPTEATDPSDGMDQVFIGICSEDFTMGELTPMSNF